MKQMKALLIDPRSQSITETTYGGLADLQKLVGGLIEAAYRWRNGDMLYVDEEGLLKPPRGFFLFAHRPDQPLVGCGVVVGPEIGDTADTRDPRITVEQLRALVTWVRR